MSKSGSPWTSYHHNLEVKVNKNIFYQTLSPEYYFIRGWLGWAMVLGSFQCRGVLLLWHMVGQGPAVLAADVEWVGYVLFLAHLSRRLTRWAYRMGRPCVRPCVHTFKHEYLRDQQADYNQILSEASVGWGKGCIRFWCRSDQNSGFHGNG